MITYKMIDIKTSDDFDSLLSDIAPLYIRVLLMN